MERNRYSEEFKKQTVKYILEQGKSMPQMSEELGISAGVLHNWKATYRDEFQTESVITPERVRQLEQQLREKDLEYQEKERQNQDLQEELAILKKALHIFSKEKN
ncbi:transposase [Paenibacillus andongensis]|uniref:transposase n=1 Tax=Paenibacillus andongensis TaxID=2975482 RepID=UPI0021BAFC1C|nr:transposase [Paenibacillus andongensis]